MRRKPKVYFDVAAPHKKARKPIAYHFPALAKLHLKGPHRRKKKVAFYGSIAGALIALVLFFQIPALFANVRSFTPVTCSGDWSNPTALTEKDSYGQAVATDPGQKIFCSFTTLNLKEPAPLVRSMLVLSFEKRTTTQAEEAPAAEQTDPSGKNEDPTVEQQIEEFLNDETPVETEAAPEETPVEPVVEEPVIEEVQEEPAPESASEEPAAFLFAAVAHAQEVETPIEESVAEEPAAEIIIEDVQESVVEEEPIPEATESVIEEETVPREALPEPTEPGAQSATPGDETPGSTLTISYTTDGTLWTDLTTFSPQDNEVTFDLDIPTTADFDRLVIRLTAESIEEEIEVSSMEVKLWTENPIEELLLPLEIAPAVGSHVFTREFTIDPKATHYCIFEPLTVDLSAATSTVFTVSLRKGDDIGEGVTGVVAEVSDSLLEVLTEEKIVMETPVEATFTEVTTEEGVAQEVTAPPEEATTTESIEDTVEEESGIVEQILAPAVEVLEDLSRIRVGTLEVGSLPMGIDIRFVNEAPYLVELFDDSPELFMLSASVFAPENAQEGSFSVPLVFTRTDGKESTIVCQMNIINRPGSVIIPETVSSEEAVIEEPMVTEPTL